LIVCQISFGPYTLLGRVPACSLVICKGGDAGVCARTGPAASRTASDHPHTEKKRLVIIKRGMPFAAEECAARSFTNHSGAGQQQ
jgi:hypothetical protein